MAQAQKQEITKAFQKHTLGIEDITVENVKAQNTQPNMKYYAHSCI